MRGTGHTSKSIPCPAVLAMQNSILHHKCHVASVQLRHQHKDPCAPPSGPIFFTKLRTYFADLPLLHRPRAANLVSSVFVVSAPPSVAGHRFAFDHIGVGAKSRLVPDGLDTSSCNRKNLDKNGRGWVELRVFLEPNTVCTWLNRASESKPMCSQKTSALQPIKFLTSASPRQSPILEGCGAQENGISKASPVLHTCSSPVRSQRNTADFQPHTCNMREP